MKPVDPQLFPYRSQQHTVGSHTLSYLDEGAGQRTILCVHGNPTWSFYWRGVVDRLRGTHRVVAVDHLGCGRSDKPSRADFDYTLAAHRDNLVSLIDSLDLRQITLVAHDWGGAIGLCSVLQRPRVMGQLAKYGSQKARACFTWTGVAQQVLRHLRRMPPPVRVPDHPAHEANEEQWADEACLLNT